MRVPVSPHPRLEEHTRGIYVVDLRGIEPLTFSLRTRRATNCATGPKLSQD